MLTRITASALVALTFFLLVLGGAVHSTGSSLACPDWPTCYGSFTPPMTGGIRFEHSHRLLASLTALVTVGLLVQSRREMREHPRLVRGSYLALLLVIVQAALGGATVLLRLSPAISQAHLLVGTTFFATTLWLAWSAHHPVQPGWRVAKGLHRIVRVTAVLAFVQILFGGLVRHTGSSLVCIGFPGCAAGAWLDWGQPRAIVHMLHRAGAFVLGVALCVVLLAALRSSAERSRVAVGLLALLTAQGVLGVLSVTSLLSVGVVVPHLAVGLLLFASLCLFDFQLGESSPRRDRSAPSASLVDSDDGPRAF